MNTTIQKSEFKILYDILTLNAVLSLELFGEMCTFIKKKKFKKGEIILESGEIETQSKIVLSGVVHQFTYQENEQITTNLTPSNFVFNSLNSYITRKPSIEIQEALTDVEILYFEKQDIDILINKSAEACYLLYRIHENILLDRENRMFLLQHRNPAKRFKLFYETVARSKYIINSAPDKFIASYINMTPQQYSKEKREYFSSKYQ